MMRDNFLSNLKLIVVKAGTSVFSSKAHPIERQAITALVRQICAIMDEGVKVVLVSSGAIGAGMNLLQMRSRPKLLPKLQAVAAIGQSQLMKAYDEDFNANAKMAAQVLLTRDDLENRKRYLNAKNTINSILEYGAIPVINENDTVSVEEIKFGDNDTLAALVTNLIGADLLIILSDVDGLYRDFGKGELIDTVKEVNAEIEELGRGTDKETSVGGMTTKIRAAKMLTGSGIPVIVANGKTENILVKIVNKEKAGTLFIPRLNKMPAKKRWIAFSAAPRGSIMVDSGATQALSAGDKSLLPSGIIGAEGEFDAGDIILIKEARKKVFARGLTNYSSREIEKIKGLKSKEIQTKLGYKYYDEVIHKDNLVII
ncbi:MAG: glutamate 5-kinase [Candidatus Omnitrophota bacterium]